MNGSGLGYITLAVNTYCVSIKKFMYYIDMDVYTLINKCSYFTNLKVA